MSRWRDPQLQVSENYSDLTKWRSMTLESWLASPFIFEMFKSWYLLKKIEYNRDQRLKGKNCEICLPFSPSALNLYNIYLDTKVTIDDADACCAHLIQGTENDLLMWNIFCSYILWNASDYWQWMPDWGVFLMKQSNSMYTLYWEADPWVGGQGLC